jgi:hypothetical protein
MSNIDIVVDADLAALFDLPPCTELTLPPPTSLSVTLPTGGALKAFADISKGIPNDCSMTFSLMLQIAPFLAMSDCLLKILKLLKPLIDVVKSLGPPPDPIKLPAAIEEFVQAAVALAPCLLVPTPLAIIPFIRDLLCLIKRVLQCLLSQLNSLLKLMQSLESQLNLANQLQNLELIGTIQCAQGNATAQAQHLTASMEPIKVLLDLASTMFEIAGVQPITLPSAGQPDVAGLTALVKSLQEAVSVITIATEALGGCPTS